MTPKLTLYSRQGCCLCDEMKAVIRSVSAQIPIELQEIDIDADAALGALYDDEVPVLFIDGRKAFKYRATVDGLTRKLKLKRRPFLMRIASLMGKDSR